MSALSYNKVSVDQDTENKDKSKKSNDTINDIEALQTNDENETKEGGNDNNGVNGPGDSIRSNSLMLDEGQNKIKTDNAPHLPLHQLLGMFLWFGCRAFGGPVAQINLMREELVDEAHWITKERFNLVYGVYQIVPGPEAYELACYFGHLSRGMIGALIGGFGFAFPGCSLELLLSYLYTLYGVKNTYVQASFKCVQVTVAAMIFRATFKLSEAILCDHNTKVFLWERGFIFMFNFLTATIGLNFFASLGISGIMNMFFERAKTHQKWLVYIAYLIAVLTVTFYFLYVGLAGKPDNSIIGSSSAGAGTGTSYGSLLILGLIAGCVSFGGAYTTIPFVFNIAVTKGGWVTPQQFLDALAICNMLPTPLVSFVATIGFIGNGIGGAILMLIGIFTPATIFPVLGHELLEKLVENSIMHPFLDGVAAAVLGLLLQTSFNFLQNVVTTGLDAAVFFMSMAVLFYFTNKFTQPLLIIVAAIAGQTLFINKL